MPEPDTAVLEFLLSRRSCPAKTLTPPVPAHDELIPILTAAARSPDHGKLEPWRFIVLERGALLRLAGLVDERGAALELPEGDIAKSRAQFADAHLAVAVIEVPTPSDKVPAIEQSYSTGAVCLGLLNAALAAGWGTNWLTGWAAHDREFVTTGLDLEARERVAGFIHIGTQPARPPERPRPDLGRITTWLSQ